jgi:hypothetical protein
MEYTEFKSCLAELAMILREIELEKIKIETIYPLTGYYVSLPLLSAPCGLPAPSATLPTPALLINPYISIKKPIKNTTVDGTANKKNRTNSKSPHKFVGEKRADKSQKTDTTPITDAEMPIILSPLLIGFLVIGSLIIKERKSINKSTIEAVIRKIKVS